MASTSSQKRCDNVARRIHERLGLWPNEIFTSRSPIQSRSDMNPPEWSVGLLESLSGLVNRFDLHQSQSGSAPSHAAGSQVPANQFLLADRLFQDLTEAVDMRIEQQATTRRGSASIAHTPARPYLTTKDVKTVRAKYSVQEKREQDRIVVEKQISGEEGARQSSEDQNTLEEEGGAGTDDPEGSDYSDNSEGSLGLSETRISSHVHEVLRLSTIRSVIASAIVTHFLSQTNSQDQPITLGGLACEAPLPTSFSAVPTGEFGAKTITGATVNHESEAVDGTSVYNVPLSQPSSSPALPNAPTFGSKRLLPIPLDVLHRHESPGHTNLATCPEPSFIPNKRPRLSSHLSGHSKCADQLGSSDVQTDLIDNNDNANTRDAMSSEMHSIHKHLRPGGSSSSILDKDFLLTLAARAQEGENKPSRFNVMMAPMRKRLALLLKEREALMILLQQNQDESDAVREGLDALSHLFSGAKKKNIEAASVLLNMGAKQNATIMKSCNVRDASAQMDLDGSFGIHLSSSCPDNS